MSTDNSPKPVVLSSTKGGFHLAPATVDGTRIYIECPDWCEGHGSNQNFLSDVTHHGEQAVLRGPRESDDLILLANMRADAFGTDTEPRFVVDWGEDIVQMSPAQALKWGEQAAAFAEKVCAIARIALESEGDE